MMLAVCMLDDYMDAVKFDTFIYSFRRGGHFNKIAFYIRGAAGWLKIEREMETK